MQFFFRTGKNTGVGVGPIGAFFVAMLYLSVIAALAALFLLYLVGLIVFALGTKLVRVARERRG